MVLKDKYVLCGGKKGENRQKEQNRIKRKNRIERKIKIERKFKMKDVYIDYVLKIFLNKVNLYFLWK